MRKSVAFTLFLVLFSCNTKQVPFRGGYPQTPVVFHSDKPFDRVWERLVDVFAQKGLAIKIIARSDGLLVSDNSRMRATVETAKGALSNPEAYIAVPYTKAKGGIRPLSGGGVAGSYYGKKELIVADVYGEWNVRIKSDGQGASITVYPGNLSYNKYNTVLKMNEKKRLDDFKSTGVFEKQLADLIK